MSFSISMIPSLIMSIAKKDQDPPYSQTKIDEADIPPNCKASDFRTYTGSAPGVLDIKNILNLPNGQPGNFLQFLIDNGSSVYQVHELTWSEIAVYLGVDSKNQEALKTAGEALAAANPGAETPYDKVSTWSGFKYGIYRFTTGHIFGISTAGKAANWVFDLLPDTGGVPTIHYIIPPLEGACEAKLEDSIKALEARITAVENEVIGDPTLRAVYTYMEGGKQKKAVAGGALTMVNNIKKRAQALLASPKAKEDCAALGKAVTELDEAAINLGTEPKPVSTPRTGNTGHRTTGGQEQPPVRGKKKRDTNIVQ